MTVEVATVPPTASLKDVATLLVERGISGLPVVDPEGRVLGVVSEGDVVVKESASDSRRLLDRLRHGNGRFAHKLSARTAGEAMTAPAVTIGPRRPVAEAAALMVERQVNRLPVVDGGRLVGIVTRADLVRAFARSDGEIRDEIREELLLHTMWIAPEALDVSVEDGRVILVGHVENEGIAHALPSLARRIPGVVEVDARLTWDQ